MSRNAYTVFQKHLVFFSVSGQPSQITFTSALRAAVALGLNFPISALLSLSLRILYAPFPYLSPINIEKIPVSAQRTQLSSYTLTKSEYTCSELLNLCRAERERAFLSSKIDESHIVGFWAMAADTRTHKVRRDDVERFQNGEWEDAVAKRRRRRDDVLPFWRGGPIGVGGHSWAVGKLLHVRVYEKNK